MLYGSMTHPGLLAALERNGHSGKTLITDGNYPVAGDTSTAAEHIFLDLAPGLLDVTRILEVLKRAVSIERAGLVMPATDAVGIKTPEVIPARDEYHAALPGMASGEIPRWSFYNAAKAEDTTVVIVSTDRRLCANLLPIIGMRTPGE